MPTRLYTEIDTYNENVQNTISMSDLTNNITGYNRKHQNVQKTDNVSSKKCGNKSTNRRPKANKSMGVVHFNDNPFIKIDKNSEYGSVLHVFHM